MKLKQMKKAAAVLLSAAMAFSTPAASGVITVSASTQNPKYVKLNTDFKTLKTGQKDYKLYLKNNKAGWKIEKITVSDKSVANAYEKKADSVLLKGKKTGRATVTLKLKTAKRKTNNVKKLKCRVNVVPAATEQEEPVTPVTPQEPVVTTSMEVSNQAELEAALANVSLKNLSIKTTDTSKLTIPAGSYPGVALSVDAPNAEIENHAVFQSVAIHAIKEDTWLEEASGNNLEIDAVQARVVVGKQASVNKIEFTRQNANLKLEVHGAVSSVAVRATLKIEISGDVLEVPVIIASNAANTELTATVPVQVTAEADASIFLDKGAEGSKIQITLRSIKLTLKNNTAGGIEVSKADGTKQTVPNTNQPVTVGGTTTTYNPGGSYGSGSSGSSSGSTNNPVQNTLPTFNITASVRSDTTTMGALLIDKKDIKINGCVNPVIKKIEYSVNRGLDRIIMEEDASGICIYRTGMLGTSELEETIEWGRGSWIYLTVEDQGTEYTGRAVMVFAEMIQTGAAKTFTGTMAKKTSITMSFDAEIISGSAIAAAPDKGWIQAVIPFDSVQFQGGTSPKLVGGSNYDMHAYLTMELKNESAENRWVAEKTGWNTYEQMIEEVKKATDGSNYFLNLTFNITDNGKNYVGAVLTKYRDFFADADSEYGKHHYTVVLYETN